MSVSRRTAGEGWETIEIIRQGRVIDADVYNDIEREFRIQSDVEPTMCEITFGTTVAPDVPTETWIDYTEIGGELIRINDAKKDSIFVLKVNGNAVQYSTPAPSAPVNIVTNKGALKHKVLGNNLMNVNDSNVIVGKYLDNSGAEKSSAANFYIAQFIKVNASTVYTASFGKQIGYFSFMEYDADFNFLKRTLYGETGKKMTSCSHTMQSTTAFVVVGSNPTSAEVTKDEILETKWMLNEGSSALPYEAYSAGLVNEGEDTISARSVNLNEGKLSSVGYTSTGGTSNSTTFCGTLCKIRVAEGQRYTVSFGGFPDGVSGVFINTWKTDGSWNTRQAISSNGKLTYTIPSGVGFANFTLYKTGGITIGADSWLQVELGTDATDYEPYAFYGKVDIERLLMCGDYVDSQDIIKGVITRKVGILVLDGTESTWSKGSNKDADGNNVFYIALNDRASGNTSLRLLSSHYSFSGTVSYSTLKAGCMSITQTTKNVYFDGKDMADLSAWKAYLAQQYAKGTPVIVVYPLATEVEESVAPQSLANPEGDFSLFRQPCIAGLGMEVTLKVKKAEGGGLKEFTLDGYPYQYEDGMTWQEWSHSDYNVETWMVIDNQVVISNDPWWGNILLYDASINSADLGDKPIEAKDYTILEGGIGGGGGM